MFNHYIILSLIVIFFFLVPRAIKGKGFECEARGGMEIKGKGRMMTHFVIARTNQTNDDDTDSDSDSASDGGM